MVVESKKASAGRVLIKPRGDWNANITYEMLDLVNHNGYAFLAKRTVVGIEPSAEHSTYWHNMLDIKTIVENNIAETVADEVGDILSERFDDKLSKARYVTDLMTDFTEATFVQWNEETENTPYKSDLTDCTEGFALVYGVYAENHTIIAWTKGGEDYAYYMHSVNNGTVKGWNILLSEKVLYTTGGTMTGPLKLGNGKGTLSADEDGTYLDSVKDSENFRRLKIKNPSIDDSTLADAIKFISLVGGKNKEYKLYGEHNISELGISKIVSGTYIGTGEKDSTVEPSVYATNSQRINLGFTPKVVIVWGPFEGYYDLTYSGMCTDTQPFLAKTKVAIEIANNSFIVYTSLNPSKSYCGRFNDVGVTYSYIAIK